MENEATPIVFVSVPKVLVVAIFEAVAKHHEDSISLENAVRRRLEMPNTHFKMSLIPNSTDKLIVKDPINFVQTYLMATTLEAMRNVIGEDAPLIETLCELFRHPMTNALRKNTSNLKNIVRHYTNIEKRTILTSNNEVRKKYLTEQRYRERENKTYKEGERDKKTVLEEIKKNSSPDAMKRLQSLYPNTEKTSRVYKTGIYDEL